MEFVLKQEAYLVQAGILLRKKLVSYIEALNYIIFLLNMNFIYFGLDRLDFSDLRIYNLLIGNFYLGNLRF